MTEYYRLNLDNRLLDLARQAINEGEEKDLSLDEIAQEFTMLIDEHSEFGRVNEPRFKAAMEQASYILNYEDGYVEGREYPVDQEN